MNSTATISADEAELRRLWESQRDEFRQAGKARRTSPTMVAISILPRRAMKTRPNSIQLEAFGGIAARGNRDVASGVRSRKM